MNERVTPDRAVEEIYDRNGLKEAEAGDFVAEKKAEAEKLYTEASNEPVTRNTGEGLSEFAQRKAEHTARVEGLKRNLDKWNQIEAAAERRNMAKTSAELTQEDLFARERDIKRQTEERVDELAKKLGDVKKVYDISEVTNLDALAELRAGRTVYGWYDRKKDEVVLYMPHVTDPGEATRTIIHEQVIHRGLSKMFKDYDNVLAEVYDKVMTPSEQQEFYGYVNGPKEGKQEDIRKKQLEAADEWIADNYQNLRFKQYNVWDKIVSSVRGILRKNGFDVDYTRRDIENLVRDSYRNLERSGAGEAPYASAEEGTMLMGSRVNKRMKEVGDIFADRELSDAERSVVDVYSGKADNQPITVTTADGQERRVVMRQGNESGAGTKHSLFRHYNTNSGAITAEDILRIPKIIAEGERKEEGRKVVYELEENGVKYKVLTEIDARREVFANFFTNRRASSAARKTRSEEARDTADDAQLADKVTANSSSDKKTGSDLTNVSENGTRFYKSNENQRIFVSNAEKAVEGIKQEKGTPEQWLKMIEKGGGLKAGEDKWMGLSDWLKEHKGKSITKQEVLDFIRENQIQIEEVKYGEANSNPAFASLKEEYDQWLREEGSDYAWKQLTDRYGDDADIAFWDLGGELAISNEEAAAALLGENVINSTRLEYTTEGLMNNREIALTVPSIEPYNSHDEIHFGDADGGRAIAWVRFGETYSYPVIEHVQKVTDFHEPYKNANQRDVYKPVGGFASGDYVVHGKGRDGNMIYVAYINDKQLPVAHATLEEARNSMNEYYKEHPRKLRKAQRVLVIDEIQSKRHQDGRENGYQTEEFIQTEKRLRELESKPHRTEEENREYRELMNKMDGMLRENPHPVPDAPFAKNWHELAMKRMLKLAAEEGYDKIAWTKGEQQAERYNIGESVKNIEVNAVTDAETGEVLENEFDVYTRSNSNGGGFITEATGRMNTEQIHEIFGKDLGGRIIEGGRTQSNTIIEGDDLRIGGEGMKGFYDKMLPSFMNKYGKKWGTKVGEVELPDVEEAGRTMWSVDVTPEMKESVMQGQTMFSKKVSEFNAETGEEVRFRKREEPDPKKTQKVYKLMRLGEDGKLYPLYIDNASAVELGQWYNADSPNLGDMKKLPSGIHLIDSEGKTTSWEDYKAANNLKGKKPNADVIRQTAENGSRWVSIVDKPTSQKRYEGENRSYYNLGINGSGQVGEFAMRPGWHAGSLPTMRQIGKGKNKDLRDDSFVWVEGEVSADKDYQQEAESNPDKDIPTHIPTDGYYLKATNANKKASQADRVGWYVAGAFKPNRIIGDSEARSIIDKWNAEHPSESVEYDFPRESGKDFEPGDTKFSKAMETELDKAFNEKLSTLNDENKDKVVFDLGRPSKILLDAGVSDKPMKLHGNKVIKKQKKHGFDLSELKGLPSAIADPIAVFDNYNKDDNRSILTELRTEQGNFLVALDLGKDGDIDFNIIRSVFGKGKEKVSTWLQRGIATYINNQKVKDFLSHPSAPIAAAAAKLSPSDAAKLNKIGELNKLLGEKLYVRTKNFKDWFGDWEKKNENASKTVDENGEPLMLWHETGNDFTVFNPRHEGAGTRDYLTPFGIFLKPSPSPIGVAREGEAKQMALYANIRNPIEFANRKELDDYLRSNCEGYAQAADAIKDIDAEYGKRLDDAERIENEAMMDIYRNHPEIWNDDAKRMEAYEKHSAESTRILEEWKGAVNRQSEALKEITDKFFRNSGHDGIVLINDEGSFGRKTKTYIAFHPNHVKSATGNVGTFSRENDDIRFRVSKEEDKAYMDAVKQGDMEAAREKMLEAAQGAGYDVYGLHGTQGEFTVFDKKRIGSSNDEGWLGRGFYFWDKSNRDYANQYAGSKGKVMEVFLSMQEPYLIEEREMERLIEASDKHDVDTLEAFTQELKDNGYDSVVDRNGQMLVFDSSQIKSADTVTYNDKGEVIPLSERFNRSNNDIRFSKKRFYDGMSAEEVHDMMGEHAEWSSGPSNLIRELEKHYKGELISASSGARHAMREGLMPVPGGKYSGQDGEYHHIEFRGKDGETYVESVPFVPAESAGERAGTLFSKSMRAIESSGTMFSVRPLLGDKNLHKGLRELKEGEKSHVERVFTENKNFEFSSMNKVESYSDIAYIFRQLEDEAIENSFAVLVKKGKPTVIHLGTGNYTGTMVNNSALNVAVNRVNPDKIYFVHNHPSGNLKASRQDEELLSNLRRMYGPKVADGIIINARSGRYGIYTPSSLHTGADYDVNHGLSDTSNARPIKVYSFSKQVFSPDYQPDALITSIDDVAKFVSSHRLGDRQKLGLIISNNKGAITGNIFLPYSEITKENARDIANDIAYYTSVVGGTRAFMFGNVPLRDVAYKGLSAYVKDFSNLHLLDYVEIDGGRHKSAYDEGIRFRFVKTPEEFESIQKEAVEKKGIVTPGLKDKVLNVVDVPKHDFTGSLKDARAEARKWAKDMYHGKEFELPDDGGKYIISNTAIDKYLDATAITNSDNAGIHLSALKELPQIISQSIDAEVHPDYKKGENGVRSEENGVGNDGLLVHRMYGAINIDGETYRVKTTMHEFLNKSFPNTPHSYEVTKIELIESSTADASSSPLNVSTNSISAAKLLNGVEKSYDKGKKLLDESETLTPVNKNAAFRKDYKAEKAQTEDRLLKGNLRETLGKGYTGFVRNLWEDKGNPLYKEMHAYVNKEMQKNGFDVNKGVESFLVSKIGSKDRGFWENVRDAYAEGMKEAGNDWKPNLVDVQYGLWLSSKKGNMNDPLFKAEAVAMRDKIAKSLPPVEVVDGAYVDTDTRFRKPVLTPAAEAARDEYDRRIRSQVSRSREAFIDSMESLRVFQEAVGGKDVEDMKNAYVRQNQESSIAHVEWEKYQERINKPLSHAVDRIITNLGVGGRDGMKQITDYMIQKHGLERNRVMYVRDTIRSIADSKPKKAEKMQ